MGKDVFRALGITDEERRKFAPIRGITLDLSEPDPNHAAIVLPNLVSMLSSWERNYFIGDGGEIIHEFRFGEDESRPTLRVVNMQGRISEVKVGDYTLTAPERVTFKEDFPAVVFSVGPRGYLNRSIEVRNDGTVITLDTPGSVKPRETS